MCGITGIISASQFDIHGNKGSIELQRIKKMTDTLIHRGPDGERFWNNNNGKVIFGHRRLAILDLSNAAAQPMHYLDRYTIIYNGEIYNYLEIKEKLVQLGYAFQSSGDTEVILAAYDCYKEKCLQHFDGMFAFAIWDEKEQSLFAARDRFGEKPFYYNCNNEQFVFASEMKALFAGGIKKKLHEKMLLNYLTLGYVQSSSDKEVTFYEYIYSLPPAHYLTISAASIKPKIHNYWKINKEASVKISTEDAIEKFAGLFSNSVQKRLRSDVAVGTSLSGGLDSSAIVSMLSKSNSNLTTFSAVFPGFEKDESRYSTAVAEQFDLKNFQVQPTAQGLIDDFEKMAYHQEEPFPSSSIYAQYKVFELASQHNVKVLLDGQGADEIFAGYTRYVHWYLQEVLSRHKLGAARKERNALLKNNIHFHWGAGNVFAAFLPSHAAIQLEKKEYLKTIRQQDLSPEFLASFRGKAWEGIHKPIVTKLNDILHFNVAELGLEELLRFADRNSMAHGREVRLPFLDHELVKFAFSLPSTFKIHDGWTKWLMRKALDKNLPKEIVWRTDKVGYEPPQKIWMEDSLVKDYIQEAKKKLFDNGILKYTALNKKILPLAAHQADNFDWRYLSAAQMF